MLSDGNNFGLQLKFMNLKNVNTVHCKGGAGKIQDN
jgi:hypothetical protein